MAELEQFPLVDFEKLDKVPSIVGNYVAAEGLGYIGDAMEPEKGQKETLPHSLLRGAINSTAQMNRQKYITGINDVAPGLAVQKRFSEGASKIEKLYCVEYDGFDVPVYMTEKEDIAPNDDVLTKNVKSIKDNLRSAYDEKGMIIELYNDNFGNKAASKYTRGDVDKIEDVLEFRNWFIRDDTWLMQQYGDRIHDDEKTIEVDGESFYVKVYARPSTLQTWMYWAVGDKIYDFIDAGFDPVQEEIEKYLSPDARQLMLKEEYKVITSVIRSVFSSRSPELRYDLRKEVLVDEPEEATEEEAANGLENGDGSAYRTLLRKKIENHFNSDDFGDRMVESGMISMN